MTLPDWTREPLVHFLALGAVIYFALTWGGETVDPASRVIEVDAEQQAEIALGFERLMGRSPTDAELDAAIDKYVRDEVLYREALRLGLDQGDAVVRQRMVAKMDQSASLAAEVAEPSEAALRTFYDENAQRYAGDVVVSFEQAFFADEAAARAAAGGTEVQGEAISLPARAEQMSALEVQALFGAQFARGLGELDSGDEWQGPVQSGFGWHLVRLLSREPVSENFEAVRDRVENDWRAAEIAARKARAYEVLRSAYRVEIDR